MLIHTILTGVSGGYRFTDTHQGTHYTQAILLLARRARNPRWARR